MREATRRRIKALTKHQLYVFQCMCEGKILAYDEGKLLRPILLNIDESFFMQLRKDTLLAVMHEDIFILTTQYTKQGRVGNRDFATVVKDSNKNEVVRFMKGELLWKTIGKYTVKGILRYNDGVVVHCLCHYDYRFIIFISGFRNLGRYA